MRNVFIIIFVLSALNSCTEKPGKVAPLPENQDHLLLPVLWYQRSAEMQALYYQGYNIAKSSLLEKLGKSDNKRPKAVIMDIDETVLDNSPVEAFQAINNQPFSTEMWNMWVDKASAEPLPGALDFINLAQSKGVEVFYVTNRKYPTEFAPTILNLKNKGFPFADSIHLVLKTTISSKEDRRKSLASRYDILLFIGDNIADFDAVFDERGEDLGFNAVKDRMNEFGSRFIILPNPMYGPWINVATKKMPEGTTRDKLMKSIISF